MERQLHAADSQLPGMQLFRALSDESIPELQTREKSKTYNPMLCLHCALLLNQSPLTARLRRLVD